MTVSLGPFLSCYLFQRAFAEHQLFAGHCSEFWAEEMAGGHTVPDLQGRRLVWSRSNLLALGIQWGRFYIACPQLDDIGPWFT